MNVVGSQHQHCVQQEQPQQHTPNCTHARLRVYLCVSWLLRTLRTRPRLDARLRIPHTVCSVRFNSKISCGEKILSAGFLRARAFVCVCARSSKGGECTKCAGLDLHLQGRRTEREEGARHLVAGAAASAALLASSLDRGILRLLQAARHSNGLCRDARPNDCGKRWEVTTPQSRPPSPVC